MSACITHPYWRISCRRSTRFIKNHHHAIRLSHIGARPIPLPRDVTCTWHKEPGVSATQGFLRFAGPMGVREVPLPEGILPSFQSNSRQSRTPQEIGQPTQVSDNAHAAEMLVMQCRDASVASQRSNWGLTAALAASCVQGVSVGSTVDLHLVGVGYRASLEMQDPSPSMSTDMREQQQQQVLVLRLGYPRPVRIAIPPGMRCEVSAPTEIRIIGNDQAALTQLAAKIRTFRPPEPYNGKGVFVGSERVQRKEVKKK